MIVEFELFVYYDLERPIGETESIRLYYCDQMQVCPSIGDDVCIRNEKFTVKKRILYLEGSTFAATIGFSAHVRSKADLEQFVMAAKNDGWSESRG